MAKERGILFTTEMVKAILDRRKTKTRRLGGLEKINEAPDDWYFTNCTVSADDCKEFLFKHHLSIADSELISCPKGKPGDRLYVRETWRIAGWDFDCYEVLVEYKDGTKHWMPMYDPTEDCMCLQDQIEKMEAKGVLEAKWGDDEEDIRYRFKKPAPWKPDIHMPKVFSRIWLEVEEIKVERVQNISEEDAKDEGSPMILSPCNWHHHYDWFRELWKKINGHESWTRNDWVMAIGFKVLSTEGSPNVHA